MQSSPDIILFLEYRTRNIQKNRRVKRSGGSTFYVPTKICQHHGFGDPNCDPETCEYAVGGAVGGEPDNVPDGHAVPNPEAATVKELKLGKHINLCPPKYAMVFSPLCFFTTESFLN